MGRIGLSSERSLLLLIALTTAVVLIPVKASPWGPEDLPSPQNDPKGICGHEGKKSAVCDPDGLLSGNSVNIIDGLVNEIVSGEEDYQLMDCAGTQRGYQIAVVIVQRMKSDRRSLPERIHHFATAVHDAWGVGDVECNNGVVLALSVLDREMYISTGAGAKDVLTDAKVQKVLQGMKPALREGSYDKAIEVGVDAIGKVLAGGKIVSGESTDSGILFPAIFFSLFWCCSCGCSSRRQRRYARCRHALRKLETDRRTARRGAYTATSCPICLEDFTSAELGVINGTTESAKQAKSDYTAIPKTEEDADAAASSAKPAPQDSTVTVGAAVVDTAESTTSTLSSESAAPTVQVLRCGHVFHTSCLKSMIEAGHDKCPICRKPIAGMDGDEDALDGQPESRNPNSNIGWDQFYPEFTFRLHRARTMYPMYVTSPMVNDWERYDHHDSMIADGRFAGLSPEAQRRAASRGSSGSSFSYGGGGSFGGGGGGSSW